MGKDRNSSASGNALQIDWEHLHALSDRDAEFEIELLSLLAQDTRVRMADLRQAASHGQFAHVQNLVHHIKGAAANMGVTTLVAIAQQLEAVDPHNIDRMEILLNTLEGVLQSLETLVSDHRA